jgi:hypothetical protein
VLGGGISRRQTRRHQLGSLGSAVTSCGVADPGPACRTMSVFMIPA